jgi:hypothetical protein
MTEKPKYRFRGERVEAALGDAARGVLEEGDLEDVWQALVTDGSESAMLLTEFKVADFANRVVSGDFGPDPRHSAWHAEAASSWTRAERSSEPAITSARASHMPKAMQ